MYELLFTVVSVIFLLNRMWVNLKDIMMTVRTVIQLSLTQKKIPMMKMMLMMKLCRVSRWVHIHITFTCRSFRLTYICHYWRTGKGSISVTGIIWSNVSMNYKVRTQSTVFQVTVMNHCTESINVYDNLPLRVPAWNSLQLHSWNVSDIKL